MARKMEKKYNRARKGVTWLGMLFFCMGYGLLLAFMVFLILAFTFYISDAKINEEYRSARSLAAMYDSGRVPDEEELRILSGRENWDYLILDESGAIVETHGENSCGEKKGTVFTLFGDMELTVYADSERDYLILDDDHFMIPDLQKIILDLQERNFMEDVVVVNGMDDEETLETIRALSLPFWLELDLEDGRQLISKAHIQMENRDVVIMAVIFAVMVLLAVFVLVVFFVGLIKNLIRQKQLRDLFYGDETTDGRNRMWFLIKGESMLKERKSAGRQYAVVNLMFVKYHNYCVCHSVAKGDTILKKVYGLINERVRPKKEINSHMEGPNFALLLEFDDKDALKRRLYDMIDVLSVVDPDHRFAFQLGVDIIPASLVNGKVRRRKYADLEINYSNACMARESMDIIEDSGIAFFDEKLVEERRWIDTVQEHQQYALDHEEFIVYYQPKYAPDTGLLRGAEALIRWQSPEFGFVGPGKFIPIFEKNGFITEIDHYMIKHVAADQRRWLDAGFHCVPVSVNVSRAHFIEDDLAEQIRDMVDAAGAPRELIEIELTESAFFDDKNAIITIINRLKRYGFAVSMDDFGSGYSSLNSLKDMALDVLKLDAEFFRGDADKERKDIVVSEAIRLAKCLNMRTVAEGVEDKEEVDFLAGQGCDMIQGYYFAKPMPKMEYEERMRQQRSDKAVKSAESGANRPAEESPAENGAVQLGKEPTDREVNAPETTGAEETDHKAKNE